MKIFIMIGAAVLGFINLFIPILPVHEDDADWIVDGSYFGYFYDDGCEEKVMNQFLGLVEAEDFDSIFSIFSEEVKRSCSAELEEGIPELVEFLNNRVTSWEYSGSYSNRGGGAGPADRTMRFLLHTAEGVYRFTIHDYIVFSYDKKTPSSKAGFHSITIFPEEMFGEYLEFCTGKDGVHIVYRAAGENEAAAKGRELMEQWMELSAAKDVDGFYEQFAPSVKNGTGMERLPEEIQELEDILGNQVTSWEPHSWTQYDETEPYDQRSCEEYFFDLHTEAADYFCGVYWTTYDKNHDENVGLQSVSLFLWMEEDEVREAPFATYRGFYDACTAGRENPGVSIILEYPTEYEE